MAAAQCAKYAAVDVIAAHPVRPAGLRRLAPAPRTIHDRTLDLVSSAAPSHDHLITCYNKKLQGRFG